MTAVAGLQEEGKLNKISYRTVPEEMRLSSNQGYVAFESRMSISKKIIDHLSNSNVSVIGLYGMAGVGKTMLVKELGRQAKEDNLFDEVVFARVSSSPNTKKIQREIADQLGVELGRGTISERASILYDRLRKERRILVILDDIWTSLKLETVGIPFGDAYRGCKILLTSRHRHVLAQKMYSQFNYYVNLLEREEAWSLFMRMAGECIEEPSLQTLAIQVAKRCGGLPISIVTVARALREKSLIEWKDAPQELLFSREKLEGFDAFDTFGTFDAFDALLYSSIVLSYNYLIDQEVKSAFLLCGLGKHPDDAPTMDLLRYGMSFSLFEGSYTMQERRDRVFSLVHKLKEVCLLLEGRTKDWFSMHDAVRDVAISIASRDHNIFSVRNDVPIQWTDKYSLKNCTAIFLHESNIGELLEGMEYPHLKSFCLNPKDPLLQIPDNFFAGMTKLRVLVLNKMKLSSLPSSFHLLQNLETLCLDQCLLGDMSIIGNLKKLEVLSLLCSDVEHLPREIGQLTKLKLLDLSNCSKLKVIPPNVISSLSQLEELYMGNTYVEWEFEGCNVERSNAGLQELKHLPHLTNLEIHIQDAMILPKGLFSKKLERYKIFIGDEWDWSGKDENTRTLKLKLPTNFYLDEIIMRLKGIEDLYLDKVPGIRNVLYELDSEGFPQLKHLHVQNNPYILYIVDSMALGRFDAFPLLESLFLHNLIHLKNICNGQLTAESFRKLRTIKVRNCHELKNIFSFSIARGLPQLQTIMVIKCMNVEEIFTVGREDSVDYKEVHKIEFAQLRSLTLKFLPQLTSFYSQVKTPATSPESHKVLTTRTWSNETILEDGLDTTMPFFNKRVVFPNLETLELCAINTEKIWHNQLATMASCIQNLTRLIVHGCDKLKYLFTFSILRNLLQLQHLEICYCTALEEIVVEERGAEVTTTFVFPKVTFLKLWNLSALRTFCPGTHTLEWPSLKRMEVYGCDKVELFTSECFSFPGISALLVVEKAPNLEELKLSGKDSTTICQFPGHLFQRLKILEVVNDESKSFPIGFLRRFHNLEKLELRCSSYTKIFASGEVKGHDGTLPCIKHLKLWELSDLRHMCKPHSVFQNLEMLEIWWCGNMINLVPSWASFGNLTTLEVWHCEQLKNLLKLSTAKTLGLLLKLRIDGCKMMTEVISNEADVAEDLIVFSKLKWLSLECLENLTSFCSGNFAFIFPSLEDLFVIECPKMKTFACRGLTTPRLQGVRQNWGLEKGFWVGDLNKTIQQLHENKWPMLPQSSRDSPSFSLAVATNANKLSSNFSGSHKTQTPFYFDEIGTENSPMLQKLASTSMSGSSSGPGGEKLNLSKLASLIEHSSKNGTRDLNLKKKLTDNIKRLPDSIGKLSSLRSLDLCENQLVALPSTVLGLSSLKKLDLHMNRLVEFPHSLGDLHNLVHLDLSGNQLKALPEAIGRLVHLEELDLGSNLLSFLPDSIASLTSLKRLIVDSNDIKVLPHTIGQCSSLRELRLEYNMLKALPETVGKMQMLEVLSVRYNNIKQLPSTMSSLSSLKELDVSFNALESMPESLCFATTIVKMNVGNNFADLRCLPRSIGNLMTLEELDISNNQIRMLPYSFRFLTRLRILRVDDTPLEVPPIHVAELGAQAVVKYMNDLTAEKPVKQKKSWAQKSFFSRFNIRKQHNKRRSITELEQQDKKEDSSF